MNKPNLHRAIAAASAAAISLGIFTAVASIANEDRALLAAAHGANALVAAKAPETINR